MPAETIEPRTPYATVPRLAGLPRVGQLHRMLSDPLGLLTAAQRRGPVVELGRLRGERYFQVNDPRFIHAFFHDTETFHMTRDSDVLKALFVDSVFMLKGKAWVERRRLLNPSFHSSQLPALAESMVPPVEEMIARWRRLAAAGEAIDLEREMLALIQKVIVKIMFGRDFDKDVDVLRTAFDIGMTYRQRRRWAPWRLPMSLPTPRNRRFHAALSQLNAIMREIVEAARREGSDRADNLLHLLLNARDAESGAVLSDAQVAEEVKTIFNTGYVTTATALTWILYALARNPEVEEEVRAELAANLDGRQPTFQDRERLRFTGRVVDETMRLFPPAWMNTRRAARDVSLGSYLLPAGSVVIASQFTAHRDPEHWPDPERFDPDRFLPEAVAGRPRFAYFPFGGGPRQCLGGRVAMLEIMIILPMLLQSFRLRLPAGLEAGLWPLSILKPRRPIPANLTAL
jgi:cytochrome P450